MRKLTTPLALFALLFAVAAHPAPPGPAPGTPGYVAPWNRPATDSVVDLDPGTKGERFEFTGRLVALDGASPMARLRVYAYHADAGGEYFDPKYPDLNHKAGVFRSGPRGGFILRSTLPGMYEGPPHVHMDADIPRKGRSAWSVNFYPDSTSWPLPNTANLAPRTSSTLEYDAVLHRDPDGIYRTHKTLHLGNWHAAASLDSLRAGVVKRYERAPWRSGTPASARPPH